MKNYFIYFAFIIFLIYIVNKLIKLVLVKVDNNIDSKKELLEYREEYKKKINEFKKLYNEIKNLYTEEQNVTNKYNQIRKNYLGTQVHCQKLGQNLEGIGDHIAKKYYDKIVPIYKNPKNSELVLEQKYRKYLDADSVQSIDYYKKLARNRPGCNPNEIDKNTGKKIDCSIIPDLPPDPRKKWSNFYIKIR